jgi:hypothetical protein
MSPIKIFAVKIRINLVWHNMKGLASDSSQGGSVNFLTGGGV